MILRHVAGETVFGAERLDAHWTHSLLTTREVVGLKVLARVAAVGADLAAQCAPYLTLAGWLRVGAGQIVQVVSVAYNHLAQHP